MKFSHNWLQKFFDESLPKPETLADKITFHSSEIEEIISLQSDTVLDVKVLPDKSSWLMSHRGLAKEISVMLSIPMTKDLFCDIPKIENSSLISINRSTPVCDYYAAALIEGVKVGPSPTWLKEALEAVGQRSINNIVDATNFVMFELGQPLHAFDAGKLRQNNGKYDIGIRQAEAKENIVTLTGETYELSPDDTIIIDSITNQPIGIAGIKGGQYAAVDLSTSTVLLESAHFNRVAVRNSAKRLKLQTDASKRFENGISSAVAPIALLRLVAIILEVAGGKSLGQTSSGDISTTKTPVVCSLSKINSVLGLSLSVSEVTNIVERFGFEHEWQDGDNIKVIPPFERDDIVIPEDLIEEIGRMHGLHHIVSIPPALMAVKEFNKRHYYAEKIRHGLIKLGFSEIYTSSFCNLDMVKLENSLASDKGYLRSTLTNNIREAREKNISNRDLLGLSAILLFEIGTVFEESNEEFRVALAVQTGTTYKAKIDDILLNEALSAVEEALGTKPVLLSNMEGVAEFSLDVLLPVLDNTVGYTEVEKTNVKKYQPFSVYPAMVRDIAMWVSEGVTTEEITDVLTKAAGELLQRVTLFDEFTKEGKTSYAFRLVFQSSQKTLTDEEVEKFMEEVYKNVLNQGWEVR